MNKTPVSGKLFGMVDKPNTNAFEEWAKALVLWAPPESSRETDKNGSDGWASSARWFRTWRQTFDAEHDPFLSFLNPWLTPSTTVLDIGAGAGRLSFPIATRVRKVIAVEASPAMLEALDEGVQSRGARNVEVIAGRWPDVEVEKVDISLCANVLYDVADLRPFLTKLDQVADRACFLYLTSRHPYDSFRELWQEFRGWVVPERPTFEDAVRCLQQLGIDPRVEIMPTRESPSFADLDEALAFAQRRLRLPDEPALVQRLRNYLSKHGKEKDGRWVPTWGRSRGIVLWWKKV